MDEPSWSWPFWKFGMTRDDLTTTLHDQYNTFHSTIQDPEAFHHDVFEVAITASTTDEFHALLASRKQQRLRELDQSLESAAFEIIAHPKLVGTEQWQYALQLFRTRSLDSLVRYFSSYLPDNYPSRRRGHGSHSPLSSASSFADYSSVATASTNPSSVAADDHDDAYDPVPTSFLSKNTTDKSVFTHEPEDIHTSLVSRIDTQLPPTPRSETEDSPSSPTDARSRHSSLRHTSTVSFVLDKPGLEQISESIEVQTPEEVQTPGSSEADLSDSRSSVDSYAFSGSESEGRRNSRDFSDEEEEEEEEDYATTQFPSDLFGHDADDGDMDVYPADDDTPVVLTADAYDYLNSGTPTPKPDGSFTFVGGSKMISPCRVRSPPLERTTPTRVVSRQRRRAESPLRCSRRTPEESYSRIQKPSAEGARGARLNGRVRIE